MRLLNVLLRGFSGHPLHPPLTDASIGAYTVATITVAIGLAGWQEPLMVGTAFVALIVGLVFAVPTALTGLGDFLSIPAGTGARRTGWLHLGIMVTATLLFLIAAFLLYPGFVDEQVPRGAAVLMLVAFGVLTVGGWVGGALAYVHGVRVRGEPGASLSEALLPHLPPADSGDAPPPR